MRNERGDISADPMDIRRIVKEDCEQLYAHKFDNIDEVASSLKDIICQNSHKKK